MEGELSNFFNAIADGIAAEHLKKPINERLARQSALTKELGSLKDSLKVPRQLTLTEEDVRSYVDWAWEHVATGDVADRKSFLQECLRRIKVDDDQVSVNYTFTPPKSESRGVGFSWLPR